MLLWYYECNLLWIDNFFESGREWRKEGVEIFFFSPRQTPTWTQIKKFLPCRRQTGGNFPVEKRKKGNYCICNGHCLRKHKRSTFRTPRLTLMFSGSSQECVGSNRQMGSHKRGHMSGWGYVMSVLPRDSSWVGTDREQSWAPHCSTRAHFFKIIYGQYTFYP